MAPTKTFYGLGASLVVIGCFFSTQVYGQQRPRGGMEVTEKDYEACIKMCKDTFPGNSPELSECVKGCSKVEGKVWTIRTAEPVKPELRQLLDGKQVREGLNLVGTSPQGVKIFVRVAKGELAGLVFADPKGRTETHGTMARRVGAGGNVGTTSQQCIDQYDRCLDECRARGGFDEYICNLGCGWDLTVCLRGVGAGGPGRGGESIRLQ